MRHDNPKHYFLCEALEDLKIFQDLLTNSWSKYYGHLLTKIVGSDTIPFFLITTEGVMLSLYDLTSDLETKYFRIENVEKQTMHITVSLLRALDMEGNVTNMMKDVIQLEKTNAKVTVDMQTILAAQLVEPNLVGRKYYVESKW